MLSKSLSLLYVVGSLWGAHMPQDTTKTLALDEITVSAGVADKRHSSLRLENIDKQAIRYEAPGRTFPELIRNVPGVYASSESGSFGDAKINIRGFKQENISVLLNGIPISGLTSGSMYWNNWMGLSDAAASIQVQKGIGNSMLSDNSVGGTINIITDQPGGEPLVEASYYGTGYGTNGLGLTLNTGLGKKGWAFSSSFSHNWGRSYVECTDLSTWSFYASLSKVFSDRHHLNLTALGSPEKHSQRSQRLSWSEVEKYGISYNKNWGWDTDENGNRYARTLSRNNYFKPYITLTDSYKFLTGNGRSVRLSSTAYIALANGGGYYTESKGRRIASLMDQDGHIDWAAARALNESSDAAMNIMSDYQAGHTQTGLRSNAVIELGKDFSLDAGLHYQFYGTWEREIITDLLGAEYWYEDYEKSSLAGIAGRDPIKTVGDYVRTQNGRNQHYGTLYAIASYDSDKLSATLGASLSGTMLRKWDRYNYVGEDAYSRWAGRPGGSVKGGVLYKPARGTALFANGAVYTRAPYANVFFSSGSNEVAKDIVNEKNYLAEIGIRQSGASYSIEATGYLAYWQDKTLMSASYKTVDVDPFKYMVRGLDALHYGFEIEAGYSPIRAIRLDAFASIGNWKWKNDVCATLYDPYTMQAAGEINVYADGLHVGDAPQTQIGASVKAHFLKYLTAMVEWNFNDRLWADFDPVGRTNPDDRSDSYRIPSYHILNASLNCDLSFRKVSCSLFVRGSNLTNALYIERSKDGKGHDRDSFTGYWGNGRSVTFGVRLGIRKQ